MPKRLATDNQPLERRIRRPFATSTACRRKDCGEAKLQPVKGLAGVRVGLR